MTWSVRTIASNATRPFQHESSRQMTAAARLDADLAAGHLPSAVPAARLGLGANLNPSIGDDHQKLIDGYDPKRVRAGRAEVHGSIRLCSAMYGLCFGIVGGFVAGSLAPILAVPAGLAVWAAVAHHAQRQASDNYAGRVDIRHDGVEAHSKFYMRPENFAMQPAEWRSYLYSVGALGDSTQGAADHGCIAGAASPALRRLARDRRLVADLGARSKYGHDLLSLINGAKADRLLSEGRQVYVVNASAVKDTQHDFHATMESPDGRNHGSDANTWEERSFRYELEPLTAAAQADQAGSGRGVPAGIFGVYAHGDQLSETVHLKGRRLYHYQSIPDHETGTDHAHGRGSFERGSVGARRTRRS